MSATTWTKFFWADWESDERLKMCSPAAQGLWMRMLCICAKSGGYLTIADHNLSSADLAQHTGWPLESVELWLGELGRWGVYSVDRTGKIFNRRMVNAEKIARKARENGSKGGNPTLLKHTGNQAPDNPGITPPDNTPLPPNGRTPESISQIPESRKEEPPSEKSDGGARRQKRGTRIPPDWRPSLDDGMFARKQGFDDDRIRRTAQVFRNYWLAATGANALKADWGATWRNWVLKDAERIPPSRKPKGAGEPFDTNDPSITSVVGGVPNYSWF